MTQDQDSQNKLEFVDESILKDLWPTLNSALAKVKESPLKGSYRDFVPLSVTPLLAESSILKDEQSIPTDLQYLFKGLGVTYKYQSDLTGEANFAFLDVAKEGGKFVASFRVHDYERTGNESYTAVDIVVYIDAAGKLCATPIVKKAIIGGGAMVPGACAQKTRDRVAKLKEIEGFGVPTIHLHGVDAETAVLYEALYPSGTEAAFTKIKENPEFATQALPQLVNIAKKLDIHKFYSLNFLSDVIYDGQRFLYLDGGSDVGTSCTKSLLISCMRLKMPPQ